MKKTKFWKSLIIGLIMVLPFWLWVGSQAFGYTETFYVCEGGDGTLPETATCGTAWDLEDLDDNGNWSSGDSDDGKIGPNDIVYIRSAGGVLRNTQGNFTIHQSGTSGKPITITNYPGETPVIVGSYDLGDTGDWTQEGETNLWYAAAALHVGNIIFDNEDSLGTLCRAKVDVDAQGEFWWDDPNNRVYVYSTSNPGTYYSAIEAAFVPSDNALINIPGNSYITISGLTLKYTAKHGIRINGYPAFAPHHIILEYNHLKYIGGFIYDANLRAGDGIVNYDNGQYIDIRYNLIEQVWDIGIQIEGAEAYTKDYINIHNNIISFCDFCTSIYQNHADASFDHYNLYNNICYRNGEGWSAGIDAGWYVSGGIFLWGMSGTFSNIDVKNNIVYSSDGSIPHIYIDNLVEAGIGNVTMDYNLYYPDSNTPFHYDDDGADDYNFADYKTNSGLDANSPTPADPLFTNAAGGDFTLTPQSPARNAGTYLPGYESKLKWTSTWPDGVLLMDDILSIGAYAVPRGAAGM